MATKLMSLVTSKQREKEGAGKGDKFNISGKFLFFIITLSEGKSVNIVKILA